MNYQGISTALTRSLSVCLLVGLACPSLCRAALAGFKPYVINYAHDKYHAANKNWIAGEDEKGIMYFGNDIGLLESDGVEWRIHPMPGLPIVRALAVESHHTIYAGGTDEFGCWKRDLSGRLRYTSFRSLLPDDGQPNGESFWRIHIDGRYVYFQSFKNIYVYDHQTVRKLTLPRGFLFMSRVGDELLVQQMYGPLYRLKEGTLIQVEGSGFLNGSLARVILPYGDGRYLIGTSEGKIYLQDRGRFVPWNEELSALLDGQELNCGVYSRARDTFYLGTLLSGIYEVDAGGNVLNHFYADNELQNNTVLFLYEDRRSNVWAALDRGLSYIRYTPGMSYCLTTDRSSSSVYDAVWWNGCLLVGTNQGVFHTSKDSADKLDLFSSLKLVKGTQGQVWSFLKSDGRLLCCHNSGVIEICPDLSIRPLYPLDTGVFRIVEGEIGRWKIRIVVAYNALYIVDKATGRMCAMRQIASPIQNAEIDHMGNIWLETVARGVYKCRLAEETDAFRYYTYYGKETDGTLPAHLKVFKFSGRIVFLGEDGFYTYSEQEDRLLPDNLLNHCFSATPGLRKLVPVTGETGWAVTSSSVFRFSYDGYVARIEEARKIEVDNLSLVNEFENVAVLDDSLSLICLEQGFIIHNSRVAGRNELHPARPFPEYIHAGNGTGGGSYMDTGRRVRVPYRDNTVTVGFSVDGVFADNLFAESMLEGVDSTWIRPQALNSVSYARLPWGRYTLRLRATDGLGNYSDDTSVDFEILPPWYCRPWAWLLAAAVVAGMLCLAYRLMRRRLLAQQRRKMQEQEVERLLVTNEQLQREIEGKNAEMFTLVSFIIRKNELILKLQELVGEVSGKNTQKSLIPLYRKINVLLAENLDTTDDWKMFLIKFEQKHGNFFKEIRSLYPQLTNNDLRLCACLKLNMATKDIASLMNLSVRAVENSRYRLRKKLNLDASQNLSELMMGIG